MLIFLFSLQLSLICNAQNNEQKPPNLIHITPSSFLANFKNTSLIDHHGKAFDVTKLISHPTLFNFIFTGCGSICPMQTKDLTSIYKDLPADIRSQIRFVSISIDPANDTPAQLNLFAKQWGADVPEWQFLTGKQAEIQQLTEKLHIFDETDTENRPQIHRTTLWLIDGKGRMLQRYRGDPIDKKRLLRELAQVSSLNLSAN